MARTSKGTGENNRQKILDTAMELIIEKGVDKTSLAAIAKATGLSKGTLYYYYASKNDLIFDIADLHMDRITKDILSADPSVNGQSTLEQLLTAFFEVLLAAKPRNRLHLYLIREAVAGNKAVQKRFQKTYAQWFSMIDDRYIRLCGDGKDIHTRSKLLVAAVEGFILQGILEVEKTDISGIVNLVLKMIDSRMELNGK